MSNLKVKKVLIVGGGIAGLSAAVALQRIGIETEIAEVQSEWNVYGVGIIQPPNALRALDELGLAEECLREGFSYSGFAYYSPQGHLISDDPSPAIDGYPGVNGVSRRILHDILLKAAQASGAKIRMGTTVEVLENLEESVYVELSDGTKGTYDLVIGSDGVNSKVRKLAFGEIKQEYVGQAVWRYTLPRPKEMNNGLFYYGKKAKAGLVPMSEKEMYLLVTSSEPGNPKMPEDKLHELLRERIAEFGGHIAELADQITDPSAVVYRPIFTHMLPSPWYRGRILIVGDAAHGTTPHIGQGASIAIEDVVVLAKLLEQDMEIPEILNAFMERRYERCRLVVDNSLQLVKWEFMAWEGNIPKDVDIAQFVVDTLTKLNEPI